METATMTVRLSPETKKRISDMALSTNRTKSYILDQAIQEYPAVHEWQVAEIKKAVRRADSPDAEWVSHEKVIKALEDTLGN